MWPLMWDLKHQEQDLLSSTSIRAVPSISTKESSSSLLILSEGFENTACILFFYVPMKFYLWTMILEFHIIFTRLAILVFDFFPPSNLKMQKGIYIYIR